MGRANVREGSWAEVRKAKGIKREIHFLSIQVGRLHLEFKNGVFLSVVNRKGF